MYPIVALNFTHTGWHPEKQMATWVHELCIFNDSNFMKALYEELSYFFSNVFHLKYLDDEQFAILTIKVAQLIT